jgi:hypothetical protein
MFQLEVAWSLQVTSFQAKEGGVGLHPSSSLAAFLVLYVFDRFCVVSVLVFAPLFWLIAVVALRGRHV